MGFPVALLEPVTIQSLEPIIRTFLCCGGGFESGILDVFNLDDA